MSASAAIPVYRATNISPFKGDRYTYIYIHIETYIATWGALIPGRAGESLIVIVEIDSYESVRTPTETRTDLRTLKKDRVGHFVVSEENENVCSQ